MCAEEYKGTSPKGIPPVIAPELEIRYLRAAMENQVAQMQLRSAEAKQKQIADEIVAICGKDYVAQEAIGPDGKMVGRLVCMAPRKTPQSP